MSHEYKLDGMIFTFESEKDCLTSLKEYYDHKIQMMNSNQLNTMSFLDYVQDKRDQFHIENIRQDSDYNTTFKQYYFGIDPSDNADKTVTTIVAPFTSWASTSGDPLGTVTTTPGGDMHSVWVNLSYNIENGLVSKTQVLKDMGIIKEEKKKEDRKIDNRFELLDLE
jgi:hypothetical protein